MNNIAEQLAAAVNTLRAAEKVATEARRLLNYLDDEQDRGAVAAQALRLSDALGLPREQWTNLVVAAQVYDPGAWLDEYLNAGIAVLTTGKSFAVIVVDDGAARVLGPYATLGVAEAVARKEGVSVYIALRSGSRVYLRSPYNGAVLRSRSTEAVA